MLKETLEIYIDNIKTDPHKDYSKLFELLDKLDDRGLKDALNHLAKITTDKVGLPKKDQSGKELKPSGEPVDDIVFNNIREHINRRLERRHQEKEPLTEIQKKRLESPNKFPPEPELHDKIREINRPRIIPQDIGEVINKYRSIGKK